MRKMQTDLMSASSEPRDEGQTPLGGEAGSHTRGSLDNARQIIDAAEVWVVLGIARDAHPQAIQNAIDIHDRMRDFLGKPRVDWADFVKKQARQYV